MLHRSPRLSLVLVLVLAGGVLSQAPTWRPELIGTPAPGWSGFAVAAVNDAGQAVGNTWTPNRRGWIAAPGQGMSLLPLPAGSNWSEANDINASGVIVGSFLDSGGLSHAILWFPAASGYTTFVLPAGPGGHVPFDARGINDAGDVVGKYGFFGGSYHWNASTGITQIPTSTFPVVPEDVNERRQIVGESYRMDLDTLVLESLGSPTNTGLNYFYTELVAINDAGECAGYSIIATSLSTNMQAVRYTDGGYTVFNTPWYSASALGISAFGDTVYQLSPSSGSPFVFVEGFGTITLQNTLDPAYSSWDLTGSFVPGISRGGRLACNGLDTATGQSGIVLLTPVAFEDLGGASRGSRGDPVLSGFGSLVPGAAARVRLASAAPGALAVIFIATASTPIPLFDGVLHAFPVGDFAVISTDSLGRFDVTFPWPSVLPGDTFYLQAAVADSGVPAGWALSNALRGVTR